MEQLVLNPEDCHFLTKKSTISKSSIISEDDNNYHIKAFIPKKINNNNLTIKYLYNLFGTDPNRFEPCFYNQDWYLNESFIHTPQQIDKWLYFDTKIPQENFGILPSKSLIEELPTALELTYVFFLIYLKYGIILWKNNYLWTSDFDEEKDQIYVGRYFDEKGLVNNGFSIHRHLSIKNNYGYIQKG